MVRSIIKSRAFWFPVLLVVFAALIIGGLKSSGVDPRWLVGRSSPEEAASFRPPPLPKVGLPDAVPDEEILLEVEPTEAKDINDARPFSNIKIHAAQPFRSALKGLERERAQMCLAIAAIYEAGGNADDQQPVMQVILNRVRHPAFPNSVCGVVFQGSERRTGCQFSFTCDGSMARWQPAPATLSRAKMLAGQMLDDKIDKRVGLSTHYHTDWVVPYWSASLDKLFSVKTHIFFVWKGYWGQPSAFKGKRAATEARVPQMAAFSAAHLPLNSDDDAASSDLALTIEPEKGDVENVPDLSAKAETKPAAPLVPVLRISLDPSAPPGRWALDALKKCGKMSECRVIGWAGNAAIVGPVTRDALIESPPDFVFVQELRNRIQTPYWDCGQWPKASTSRCLGSPQETARLVGAR